MSDRKVCDRCKAVEGVDSKESMVELNLEIIDPERGESDDNVLFWTHMDLCNKCLGHVETILVSRLLTQSTPGDVHGGLSFQSSERGSDEHDESSE